MRIELAKDVIYIGGYQLIIFRACSYMQVFIDIVIIVYDLYVYSDSICMYMCVYM